MNDKQIESAIDLMVEADDDLPAEYKSTGNDVQDGVIAKSEEDYMFTHRFGAPTLSRVVLRDTQGVTSNSAARYQTALQKRGRRKEFFHQNDFDDLKAAKADFRARCKQMEVKPIKEEIEN